MAKTWRRLPAKARQQLSDERLNSVFVVHTNTPGRRHENLNDTQFGYFGYLKTSNDGVTS
jgi:hypothetical protein